MKVHDAVVLYRRRVVELVEGSENRRAACRQLGIHHSTFYRWRNKVDEADPSTSTRSKSWAESSVQARGPIQRWVRNGSLTSSESKEWPCPLPECGGPCANTGSTPGPSDTNC